MQNDKITIIKPAKGFTGTGIKEVMGSKDLVALLVRKNFVTQYKQTILGPLWAFIKPFITTVVFTVVFGNIAKLPTDKVPAFLFYMASNILWAYFSGCFSASAGTFTANHSLFGKVYFPRLAMPISSVISKLIGFGIQMIMFLAFWIYYMYKGHGVIHPNLYLLLVPLLILQVAMLAMGIGSIIASITVKYRDLAMLTDFITQLWMYATPVAYASSLVSKKWIGLYMLNPLTPIMELFRYAFFSSGTVDLKYFAISICVTIVLFYAGLLSFSRSEKNFLDTI